MVCLFIVEMIKLIQGQAQAVEGWWFLEILLVIQL